MEARNDIPLRSVSPVSPVSRETLFHEANNTYHSDEHEIPSYDATRGDALPPYERRNLVKLDSTPLSRNIYILIPTAIYTCMALYSWVTFCLLSQAGDLVTNEHNTKLTQYKAARVFQIITSVATIPIISLVCAWASAVYVQNQRDAHSLRLRQVMTLADRGWMNPLTWCRLLFHPSGFKRYGSALLVLAIFMHIIGAITYPIQSLFLSHRLVYVEPVKGWGDHNYYPSQLSGKSIQQFLGEPVSITPILSLRNALQVDGINGFQSQLWGDTGVLSEINPDTNWFSELPNNFSTGLYPDQYIPRVNSSVSIQNMTAGEFPSNCSEMQDWFYAFYTYPNSYLNLTLEVCLPVNGSQSPWKGTDGRQDFSEVLYVNPNFQNLAHGFVNATPFIVTMNTTAGAFKLPSIMTNQESGPLDANSSLCLGYLCNGRGYPRQDVNRFEAALPGPLTMIALALFGPGSFTDTQQNATDTNYLHTNDTGWNQYFDRVSYYEPIPLENLGLKPPIEGNLAIETLMMAFSYNQNLEATTSAFTQASFLAIKAMFDSYSYGHFTIFYSSSAIEQISIPSMPLGGLIAGSILLALYIIPLLCLALYSAATPRWTHTLDAFTMLRMGAAFGQEHLPFLVGKSTRGITALDDLPGVVRDISGPDDKVRQLALGVGGAPLQASKHYLAYPGNDHRRL
ncbi:uncharacterized protein TRUGW13939_11695 [Talaromyces rugulosus]|uniref:Uncharacterized protein n=1 Tax=Talaromyces rugulosus TaxID=121627 RepID=A0A7H8RDF6_TALRU|nr:uncharacterized protein TRUGW13939_11695 [Talaromyces rugulosus]QKX64520.1 hypothetical protein TRUGW13939_11695 [Talaromyces rugulosus]